jgi:hypothetical protein
MPNLTLYSNDGSIDIVIDAKTLRIIEPVSVRNVFDDYDGWEATWKLDPGKKYLIIKMIKLRGGGYDVWAYLGKVPKDNTMTYKKRYHFWAKSIPTGIGRALRVMKLLRDDEVWLPQLI